MAMVTKMESETRMLIDELQLELPDVTSKLKKIYSDFESDAKELIREMMPSLSFQEVHSTPIS